MDTHMQTTYKKKKKKKDKKNQQPKNPPIFSEVYISNIYYINKQLDSLQYQTLHSQLSLKKKQNMQ